MRDCAAGRDCSGRAVRSTTAALAGHSEWPDSRASAVGTRDSGASVPGKSRPGSRRRRPATPRRAQRPPRGRPSSRSRTARCNEYPRVPHTRVPSSTLEYPRVPHTRVPSSSTAYPGRYLMMQTGARRLIAASIESMCVDSAGLPRNAARFAAACHAIRRGMPAKCATPHASTHRHAVVARGRRSATPRTADGAWRQSTRALTGVRGDGDEDEERPPKLEDSTRHVGDARIGP
jgi:hypothetical protein